MEGDSREMALGMEFLLGEILQRSKCSRSFLRASAVSKFWRSTAQIPAVAGAFCSRNEAAFVGFIAEYDEGFGREKKLFFPPGSPMDDPARGMRANFNPDAFHDLYVLGSHGGCVISRMEAPGKRHGKLYMSCPYSRPRKFTAVGLPVPPIPKTPGQYTDNTYGQFVVLADTGVFGSNYPGFFVRDAAGLYQQPYEGVRFMSSTNVHVHVCVFRSGSWSRFVSDPLTPPPLAIFHRNPYCVQARSVLYIMYLVGFIVCFNMEEGQFVVLNLPGEMATMTKSCLQYIAGPYPEGDLAVVHMDNRKLVKWVLLREEGMVNWHRDTSFDLVAAFGDIMNREIFTALTIDPSEWRSFQMRAISSDSRYVLITVGVNQGLFVADMAEEKVEEVTNYQEYGKMGRVFSLSENWPPKP